MNRIDNEHFYHSGIVKYGFTPEGLRWNSRESQEIRFSQLLSLLPLEALSVVDAGCGFADLFVYIRSQRNSIDYTGLDSLEIMVQEASRRTGASIYRCDILTDSLPMAEFYLCSGALNILTHNASYRFIERCYAASTRGVIFNFLEGHQESKTFNYLHTAKINALADKLGARVIFRRHYYENDCTAAFYK